MSKLKKVEVFFHGTIMNTVCAKTVEDFFGSCFIEKTKLGHIQHALLRKCKKGARRNYPTKTLKSAVTFTFKETVDAPLLDHVYNWMDAISNNPIAEIGLMAGDDNG